MFFYIQSQSVEKRHCVIEWDQKRESYVIRDLGTVNGVRLVHKPLFSFWDGRV